MVKVCLKKETGVTQRKPKFQKRKRAKLNASERYKTKITEYLKRHSSLGIERYMRKIKLMTLNLI